MNLRLLFSVANFSVAFVSMGVYYYWFVNYKLQESALKDSKKTKTDQENPEEKKVLIT